MWDRHGICSGTNARLPARSPEAQSLRGLYQVYGLMLRTGNVRIYFRVGAFDFQIGYANNERAYRFRKRSP